MILTFNTPNLSQIKLKYAFLTIFMVEYECISNLFLYLRNRKYSYRYDKLDHHSVDYSHRIVDRRPFLVIKKAFYPSKKQKQDAVGVYHLQPNQ